MRYCWVLLILALSVCVFVGCETPLQLDRDTEIEIGRQGAADLEGQYGVLDDRAMQQRLESIGKRVAAVSEEPSFPWTFKILNTTEINAIALPGGFIYATKGMMGYVKSDDQLGGVIAHEVVHVDHHHAKSAIEKAMTQALLVELVTRKSSESLKQAAAIALDLELRQGYREKEYDADHYGTFYAFRAGYRADGLRQLLALLLADQGDPARITWVLQTHPPLSKRIQRLDEYVPTLTGRPARS
jgi:predicted Zn-dependent protease